MPVAYFQRTAGRQALGRNFCEAEPAEREQKFIHCAFAARGSQRPENRPVACFQRERAGRPWKKIHSLRLCRPGVPKGREAKARGFPKWGSEGPENRPVACFHRRTGRQALVVSPFRGLCNSPIIFHFVIRLLQPSGIRNRRQFPDQADRSTDRPSSFW